MVLVVAAIATPLHRAQLRKLLLPITEHMRFDPAQVADLTDGEVAFCGNGGKGILQLNQCAKAETSKSTLSYSLAQRLILFFFRVLRGDTRCCTISKRLQTKEQEKTSGLRCFWRSGCSADGLNLNLLFELVAGMKGHDAASFNRNGFPGTRVTPWPGCFGTYLKIAEA